MITHVLSSLLTVAGFVSAPVQATVGATDRTVNFVVEGTTTYGTLHVPAHKAGARLPAALLIPGSGATDRDGDVPAAGVTPGTLRLIAGVLGEAGVMTYRFDKYASGQTGLGRFADDPTRMDMPAFTRQAAAAYDTLRAQPQADPHRMMIVGHSEGGLQALLVARTEHPAALGLLAPQDLRLLDMIDFQLAGQVDAQAAAGAITAADAAATKTGITRVIAQFRAGSPVDTTGMLPAYASLFTDAIFSPVNSRFVRTDDAIYPPDVAREVRPGTRVLLTCGGADTQVPCWTTRAEMDVLNTRHIKGPGLRVLPDVDHFLHPAGTPTNDQTLSPLARQALLDLVRSVR